MKLINAKYSYTAKTCLYGNGLVLSQTGTVTVRNCESKAELLRNIEEHCRAELAPRDRQKKMTITLTRIK
jgi:hypothetical protein